MMTSATPLPRRRRVELACTTCRKKKSRCDGRRPSCSSCVDSQLTCVWTDATLEVSKKRRREGSANPELLQRVRELEARLDTLSANKGLVHDSLSTERDVSSPNATENRESDDPGDEKDVADINIAEEVPVDTLATGTFDDIPMSEMGYFGPTSNHALFRTISDVFAQFVQVANINQIHSADRIAQLRQKHALTSPSLPRFKKLSAREAETLAACYLPEKKVMVKLVDRFFATVGAALPIINHAAVISIVNQDQPLRAQRQSRPVLAVLNMIFAYASRDEDSRIYYRRALSLLNERTLRGSSLALVQALLLVCSYQQNNQRSIASWTYHALVVKAALQVGLHSPASYGIDIPAGEIELRKRIWHAIVNQDRILSPSLGRPGLIHPHCLRVPLHDAPSLEWGDNLTLFRHLTQLHGVKALTIEMLYGSNVEGLDQLSISDLLVRRLDLAWKLEQWRESTGLLHLTPLQTAANLTEASYFETNKFEVILEIYYYSVVLLINSPVLTALLTSLEGKKDTSFLLDSALPILKSDQNAAEALQGLIYSAAIYGGTFVDDNAIWWTCNYSALTTSLHLFGILLACHRQPVVCGMTIDADNVRASLDRALLTLNTIARSSPMSLKARHCLRGFLEIFDTLDYRSGMRNSNEMSRNALSIPELTGQVGASQVGSSLDCFSQLVTQAADAFLLDCSQNSFLDADLGFLVNANGDYPWT